MMMKEFVERTGFKPTNEEYAEIEQDYYEFDGDKNAFCKSWLANGGIEEIHELRLAKIDAQAERIEKLNKRIAELEAQLDKEQEWTAYEDKHNVRQADYEHLASVGDTKELTDDEAVELIANEFGFERSKIKIVHRVARFEINRHRETRRAGWYERKALYNATDWNYILFNVRGNVTMGYEMHDGELQMYWG